MGIQGLWVHADVLCVSCRPWAKVKVGGNVNPHHISREEAEEGFAIEDSRGIGRASCRGNGDDASRSENAVSITSSSRADTPIMKPAPTLAPNRSSPEWRQDRPFTATAQKTSSHSWTSAASSVSAAKALEAQRALKAKDLAGRGLLAKRQLER